MEHTAESTTSRTSPIIGNSRILQDLINKTPRMARSEATVLILGETGTGKELFARAIHYQSARSRKPFIPVNCGALPDQLFENELFGHVKGAFTDASGSEKGLLAEADGGTFFFDEIDALSLTSQVKLLRLLQDGEYRPLGSPRPLTANVRIVAATNADLTEMMRQRRFREDLFHRLNVLSLSVPPLRDRIGDLPLLATHFVKKYASDSVNGTMRIAAAAMQKLLAYQWPGNVRELERVIQRAMILAPGPEIQAEDFDIPAIRQIQIESFRTAKNRAIREFELWYLTNLIASYRGNISKAARAAGKERRSLQRLLLKHGLDRSAYALRACGSDTARIS